MSERHYGLLQHSENRFYLVDTNYKLVKMVQHLLIKDRFFYCIDLGENLPFSTNDCYNYGCSSYAIRNVKLDIRLEGMQDSYIISCPSASPMNRDLADNLKFLFSVMKMTDYVFDSFAETEYAKLETNVNGLEEFKTFMSLVMPEDRFYSDLVESEKSVYVKVSQRLESVRRLLVQYLFELDYHQPLATVKSDLKEKINKMPRHPDVKSQRLIDNLLGGITR